MKPSNKRIKSDSNGGGSGSSGEGGGNGGGGSGDGGGRGNNNRRSSVPPDLALVGRILATPSPKVHMGSGGKMLTAHVETRITDIYRLSQWWIELPNVDDVEDVNRKKVMVKALPLGAPETSSNVAVASGSQGRMRFENMSLALFESGGERKDELARKMIAGKPPAWFNDIWKAKHGEKLARLADEFKNAKVYVTRGQALQQDLDWLIL